jgi:hypothetical protein
MDQRGEFAASSLLVHRLRAQLTIVFLVTIMASVIVVNKGKGEVK